MNQKINPTPAFFHLYNMYKLNYGFQSLQTFVYCSTMRLRFHAVRARPTVRDWRDLLRRTLQVHSPVMGLARGLTLPRVSQFCPAATTTASTVSKFVKFSRQCMRYEGLDTNMFFRLKTGTGLAI